MAGAGYKLFNTGDVLTAAQVNTYLMEQTVMVFANAAARTTALSGVVSEGMISYLKDTNAVEVYDGSNWVSSDDPNAIQNTIVDAKGDLITATASDVPARLAVGSNDQILMADSAQSTGLKWAGGWTTWTPTYLNFTPGNATIIARYRRIGNTVEYFWRATWGSTTSTGNYPIVSYPVTPAYTTFYSGFGTYVDTGVSTYLGRIFVDTTNGLLMMVEYTGGTWNVDGVIQSTNPVTWTTNDVWTIYGSYEV